MGWLRRFLAKLPAGDASTEFIFVPSIPSSGVPGIGQPIQSDTCYVELYLESLRLTCARRFASRFHGVVYSFVSLAREGEAKASLSAISKPEKLTELDKDSLDRVITVSKQMMAPAAYRGGPISLEFGLFSVKSGNLLTPIVDYITRVSSTAGISYVGAIKPFLPLLTEGMDLIAGQREDTALEVGIDMDIELSTGCVAAIIALPKDSIDTSRLSLDSDRRLLLDGKSLDCGYAVFSLRSTLQKHDYGEIPELRNRFAALVAAINNAKRKDALDALAAFRLATVASPDLVSADAKALYKKAKSKYDDAFPPGGIADKSAAPDISEALSDIGLYD